MAGSFAINPGWRILLTDLGISTANILRRAELAGDLFARTHPTLVPDEYFRLWRAIDAERNDPTLPIRIAQAASAEAFDPPVFAALCSTDLNAALARIATYKRLVGPLALTVDVGARETVLGFRFLDPGADPPPIMIATELCFFVQLARTATRHPIRPRAVTAPAPPTASEFQTYLGVPVTHAPIASISFAAADAARPFLTADEPMWQFFEPVLRRRLADLDEHATIVARVRGALVELLPTGEASVEAVSARLGTSKRTLQRRLQQERASFQQVLDAIRAELARHYLRSSMTAAEISFLLGYEDPNSFFRAFHAWTGQTPEQARLALTEVRERA